MPDTSGRIVNSNGAVDKVAILRIVHINSALLKVWFGRSIDPIHRAHNANGALPFLSTALTIPKYMNSSHTYAKVNQLGSRRIDAASEEASPSGNGLIGITMNKTRFDRSAFSFHHSTTLFCVSISLYIFLSNV